VAVKLYLEAGKKKVFAVSLAWPGWARSGKDDESAIESLLSYAPRYAAIASAAQLRFPARPGPAEVVERLEGNASTDFGVPARFASTDADPPTPKETEKLVAVVTSAWQAFEELSASAPESLRKGPRGGGRDRDKMVLHVIEAEVAYARKLGVKHRTPALGDTEAITALREDILAALRARTNREGGWPVRYAARRIAWHVLDHLWEMEDRIEP
jgi:hypothetical protein